MIAAVRLNMCVPRTVAASMLHVMQFAIHSVCDSRGLPFTWLVLFLAG
jgi:hypothetical protein